jgi:FAD/FMN-containing dehydrogenase
MLAGELSRQHHLMNTVEHSLPPVDWVALRAAFQGRLLTDPADMAPFLTDWRRQWHGAALAVVQPDRTDDVAAVVRWCQQARVAVVPQGGNTGLSGGSVPASADEPDGPQGRCIVLSLKRLNRVRALDAENNTLTLEAGVTLQAAQEQAAQAGRLFALSLAAEGSCTVGGNLATNAGGVHVLRYGTARELCLGLEVVTAEGEIWHGLRGLRKDNTGYDLRDLYIGSEGTLGVITAAVFKLHPPAAAQAVALWSAPSAAAATRVLHQALARCGAQLTAFELMNPLCMALVQRHMPGPVWPLAHAAPWYVLMEVCAACDATCAQALEDVLGSAMATGDCNEAVLSHNEGQFQALWAWRENISEAQGAEGRTLKHDISLPISRVASFIDSASNALAQHHPALRLVVFGHLGDGNLHFNLSPPVDACGPEQAAAFLALEPRVNTLVHDLVQAHGGSISAEHGLGVLRRDEAARRRDPVAHRLMLRLKAALDPHGLMNPGKVLPRD